MLKYPTIFQLDTFTCFVKEQKTSVRESADKQAKLDIEIDMIAARMERDEAQHRVRVISCPMIGLLLCPFSNMSKLYGPYDE